MSSDNHLIIYSDGGARGNPGPAGIGAVIMDSKCVVVATISKYLGRATNNQAEYQAILAGLEQAHELGAKQATCYLDSELVVKQLNREYRVKNKDLQPWFVKIYNLALKFKKVEFLYIPREKNKAADKLANQAMDNGL